MPELRETISPAAEAQLRLRGKGSPGFTSDLYGRVACPLWRCFPPRVFCVSTANIFPAFRARHLAALELDLHTHGAFAILQQVVIGESSPRFDFDGTTQEISGFSLPGI